MIKKTGLILFFVSLIFGLYFLNSGLNIFPVPSFLISLDKIINILGGILIIVGGLIALRRFSYKIIR